MHSGAGVPDFFPFPRHHSSKPLVGAVLIALGTFLGVIGLPSSAAHAAAAAGNVAPRHLPVILPSNEKVTSVRSVRLGATGPRLEMVTTSSSCSLSVIECSRSPWYNGTGYPSRNLLLLAWDRIAQHWYVAFDAAESGLFPAQGYGFVTGIATSTITPVRGTTDFVASAILTPGANSQLNVGIVHFDGQAGTLVFHGSYLDGVSAGVTGAPPHQHLKLTIGWLTDADPVCCPVRAYTQTIGWANAAPGRPGRFRIDTDSRSWLGVAVSVRPSDGPFPNSPRVLSVAPLGPASGVLEPGDTLLGVEGASPGTYLIGSTVIDEIASKQPGTRIALSIQRDGSRKIVHLTLASYASSSMRAYAANAVGLPYFGVEAADLTPPLRRMYRAWSNSGAVIIGVASGSPADEAGLRTGDVIVEVGSQQVTDTRDLSAPVHRLYLNQPGLTWRITFNDSGVAQVLPAVTTSNYQMEWRYFPEVTLL